VAYVARIAPVLVTWLSTSRFDHRQVSTAPSLRSSFEVWRAAKQR
jgi:hypothetical protein